MGRLAGPFEVTVQSLCALYLRPCQIAGDPVTGIYTFIFTPALTVAEQATFADIQLMAKFGVTVTLAEFQTTIKPAIAVRNTFKSRTRAQFIARTPAQQAGDLYDLCIAITDVLATIIRN